MCRSLITIVFAFQLAVFSGCERNPADAVGRPGGMSSLEPQVTAVARSQVSAEGSGAPEDSAEDLVAPLKGATPFLAPHDAVAARPPGRRIDAHAHLGGFGLWSDLEPILDESGIDYIFNLSGGSPRRGQTMAMMLSSESGGRVINFMNVDWDGIDEVAYGDLLAAELELLVTAYGYGGLKISKALGLYVRDGLDRLIPVDDPRLFPLWEKAGELGVPVFIHTGDPAAFWAPVTPENERYDELVLHPSWSFADPEFPPRDVLLTQRDHLLELFPDTIFVGVHFGGNPEDIEYIDRTLARYPNFRVDLAARIGEIGRHDPERLREILVRHQDRILFATDIMVHRQRGRIEYVLGSAGADPPTRADVPRFYAAHWEFLETDHQGIAHPTPIQGDWTVDAVALPAEVLDKLYYLNAHRLVLERLVAEPPLDFVLRR